MQVIDVIAGPFRLPDWTATLVLFLLMIGPPVALILSWAFELTPDGVKKTAEVEIGGSTVNDEFGASSH